MGDRVRLQNVKEKHWNLIGTVDRKRTADDGQILSYDVLTDKGYMTSRHRRYMKHLTDDINKNDNNIGEETHSEESKEISDKVVKRRSPRLKGAGATSSVSVVKSIRTSMGCEISYQRPIEAEVRVVIEGEKIEIKKLVTRAEDNCSDTECNVCKNNSPGGSTNAGGTIGLQTLVQTDTGEPVEAQNDLEENELDDTPVRARSDAFRERMKRRRRLHREKKRLLRRQLREMANLKRNGSGNSHGGSSEGRSSLGARANYHSDTPGRTRGIVEVITLNCSDTEDEEEVRFVGKKRRGEY